MTQSDLRAKQGIWKQEAIDERHQELRQQVLPKHSATGGYYTTPIPIYEIFERNGEVSERTLFEAQGKEGGDENKYLLARIIVAGLANEKDEEKFVLFAEPLKGKMSDRFVEAHRGPYKGRWWREGLYELLIDHQYRANEIAQPDRSRPRLGFPRHLQGRQSRHHAEHPHRHGERRHHQVRRISRR